MTVELHYRIDSEVKDDFNDFIEEKYGQKKKKCGSELSKWMKLCLAIGGRDKYSDDPDVKAMIQSIKEDNPCTHTHTPDPNDDGDSDTNWNDDEYLEAKIDNAINKRFQKFEEFFQKFDENMDKKVEQKVRKELENTYSYSSTPPKQSPMDMFLESFQKEYGEWTQVSYNELSHLAVQIHGVSDKRSIQNRINYLLGKGVIKEFSTNVYDVIY